MLHRLLRCILSTVLLSSWPWEVNGAPAGCFSLHGSNGCSPVSAPETSTVFNFRATGLSGFQRSLEVSAKDYDTIYGASLPIYSSIDTPSLTYSKYILHGKVEVFLKGVAEDGIVTAVRLKSDDLDDISLEITGGNGHHLVPRGVIHGREMTPQSTSGPDSAGIFLQANDFHNLTIEWTSESVQWLANGHVVGNLSRTGEEHLQVPYQIQISARVAGHHSTGDQAADMGHSPYFVRVMNATMTDYGDDFIETTRPSKGDTACPPSGMDTAQESLAYSSHMTVEASTEKTIETRSRSSDAQAAEQAAAAAKLRLNVGLALGLGGGSLVLSVIFFLLRVNGYCSCRRMTKVVAAPTHAISPRSSTHPSVVPQSKVPGGGGGGGGGSGAVPRRNPRDSGGKGPNHHLLRGSSMSKGAGRETPPPRSNDNRGSLATSDNTLTSPGRSKIRYSAFTVRKDSLGEPIPELDGRAIEPEVALVIRKKRTWDLKPLPSIPQLAESVRSIKSRRGDTRYALHAL